MGYNPLTVLPFSTLLKTHFGCTLYIPPILLKAYRRLWDNLPPCWASDKYAGLQRLPLCQHYPAYRRGARRKASLFPKKSNHSKMGYIWGGLNFNSRTFVLTVENPSSSRKVGILPQRTQSCCLILTKETGWFGNFDDWQQISQRSQRGMRTSRAGDCSLVELVVSSVYSVC